MFWEKDHFESKHLHFKSGLITHHHWLPNK